ncbi:MAG: hypothetical protein ACE5H9_06580 [Anaerolineae bacterium]
MTEEETRLSEAIDRMLAGQPAAVEGREAELLAIAAALRDWGGRLSTVEDEVAGQILRRVFKEERSGLERWQTPRPLDQSSPTFERATRSWQGARRWRFALASAALLLVLAFFVSPPGQAVVAEVAGVFGLGRTQIEIGPPLAATALASERRQPVTALVTAEALLDTALLSAEVPSGYRQAAIEVLYYDGLSPDVPQPLFVEITYQTADGATFYLTQGSIRPGRNVEIEQLRFLAGQVAAGEPVMVGELPAVLLVLGEPAGRPVRNLVWEQGEMLVKLSSSDLSAEALIEIATQLR